jgi:hypothetical protein
LEIAGAGRLRLRLQKRSALICNRNLPFLDGYQVR